VDCERYEIYYRHEYCFEIMYSISRTPDEIVTTWRLCVLELDMPFAMCHYPDPRF